jgi:hypothetical protein
MQNLEMRCGMAWITAWWDAAEESWAHLDEQCLDEHRLDEHSLDEHCLGDDDESRPAGERAGAAPPA